jgi:MoaA/NifB/PqqE/SkfB family radical SAM enzyme
VVELLAEVSAVLYITGGEPTMRTDLVEILKHARKSGISYIAMNTNALLLRDHEEILDLLDNLVISVDSLEVGRRDTVLATQPENIQKLLDNVRWAATQQKARGFTLTITSVLTPGQIADARKVRDFTYSIGAQYSCQGVSVERLPSVDLPKDPEYHAFLNELIADKRSGKNISGSELYLSGVRDHRPYQCTPTAAPHVDWLGRLAYPCREMPDHIWIDLAEAGSYKAALAEGERQYHAPPPTDCMRCGERCYVEVSTLVRNPGKLPFEVAGYLKQWAANRGTKANVRSSNGASNGAAKANGAHGNGAGNGTSAANGAGNGTSAANGAGNGTANGAANGAGNGTANGAGNGTSAANGANGATNGTAATNGAPRVNG